MSARLRAALLLLATAGCASAPLPEDPYERELALNDRHSLSCDIMSGVVMSPADNAACQARAAAKRQQIVAEEMQRRQAEEMRKQTDAMTKALEQTPATTTTTAATAQWCTVVIDGGKATEACFGQRADCNVAWGDIKAAGKAASDCAEKLVAAPPPEPVSPTAGQWCMTVDVEGTSTPACYTAQAECTAAFDYHRQSGTKVSKCEASQ